MNIKSFTNTFALILLGSLIVPQIASARTFKNNTVRCYFFKGETPVMEETCKSDGGSWAGGGGHSLKWGDGVTTSIKFGLQGKGTPTCPSKDQMSVDGKCGKTYYRSTKTLKQVSGPSDNTILCVQLDRKSVCWGGFKE
jgi:hypothetical protein